MFHPGINVVTGAVVDLTPMQAVLVGLASTGVVSVYLRLHPRIAGRIVRGGMALALALAITAGLASAEGVQGLVSALAFWGLCVLGVGQLVDWARAGMSPRRDRGTASGQASRDRARPHARADPEVASLPEGAHERPRDRPREHARADPEVAFRRDAARGDPGATFNLGQLLAKRGDLKEAQAAYRRADERGHREAAYSLGGLLRASGDLDAAEAAYARAEERGHGEAAYKLGMLMRERGDLEAAEAAFRRAEEADHPNGASCLATLLKRRGDHPGAEAAQRRREELLRRRQRVPETSSEAPARPASVTGYRTPAPAPSDGAPRSRPTPPRRYASTRPAVEQPKKSRCKVCKDGRGKVIYAGREEAWKAVTDSQRRRAAGKPVNVVLDHAYYEERCLSWHVSSQRY